MSEADNPGNLPFGTLLKQFRQHAKLKQSALAYAIGKQSRGSIQAWESGLYLPNDRNIVLALARALRLTKSETDTLLLAAHYSQEYSTQGAVLSSASTSSTPKEAGVWYVPYLRNPHFTGRDELLDQITRYFKPLKQNNPINGRKVALTQPQAIKGLGGIGKTQIAVEYAYRAREQGDYAHTLWVNAANEETIMTSFVAIADLLPSFAAKGETDQRRLIEAIKRWLEDCEQQWLLIFDNADDIALVRDYLPQRGNGSILLTTRFNAVGSLAISVEVKKMGFIEGTHLLLRRAQRFEQASDEVINQAGNIAVALDHFPLALDQAGAYIEETQCSFVDYLQIYQNQRKTLLAKRGLQATNYPDSVATTWSLSFQKVEQANPAAAELLRLCAFLAPDAIPEELIQIGASRWNARLQRAATDTFAFNQMIEELLKFSLVERLVETQTFRMLSVHRLVQAVLIDTMRRDTQRRWAERVILALDDIFLDANDVPSWPRYLRYLSQAQMCSMHMEQYKLIMVEAARLLNQTGMFLVHQAIYPVAQLLFQRALTMNEHLLGDSHPDIASSLNNLAVLYRTQGKYAEAEPLYRRALAIREQQLGPDHPKTALSLNNLATCYQTQEKYAEAEPLCQRALAISEQRLGPDHPETARYLSNLAGLYRAQKKYAEAEPLFVRSLAIREQQLGANHPDTAHSLANLALLYQDQKKYAKAASLYQRALAICKQQLEPDHPTTAQYLSNLATLYANQKKYVQAESLYQQALAIRERQLGPDHPQTVLSLNNLADTYTDQRKYAEAEPLYQRLLAFQEQQLGPDHPKLAHSLSNLALLYTDQGRYNEAELLLKRALSIHEHVLGQDHATTRKTRKLYTVLLQAMEHDVDAKKPQKNL